MPYLETAWTQEVVVMARQFCSKQKTHQQLVTSYPDSGDLGSGSSQRCSSILCLALVAARWELAFTQGAQEANAVSDLPNSLD